VQISGRMAMENTLLISHETIYQHIYYDKSIHGDLYLHLRCQKMTWTSYSEWLVANNSEGIFIIGYSYLCLNPKTPQ